MEVRTTDLRETLRILEQDHLESTRLVHHDLNCTGTVFDENAATTVCPACGTTFSPGSTMTCPDCGLNFG